VKRTIKIIVLIVTLISCAFYLSISERKIEHVVVNLNLTKYIEEENLNLYNEVKDKLYQLKLDAVIESFTGIMTGYGPDCAGCGGKLSCAPRHIVTTGNIHYEDIDYGKVRIVAAATTKFPCGTIVKISNFYMSEDAIVAIVLDTGGDMRKAYNNGIIWMDLLHATEKDTIAVGKQKDINYDILRYGW